jgi:hypothetical protein
MNVVVSSRIQGTFVGYAPGVVHRLDVETGEVWQAVQEGGCGGTGRLH